LRKKRKKTKAGGGGKSAIGREAVHIEQARFVRCNIVG